MMTTKDTSPSRGPLGTQIPRAGLDVAEDLAKKLWDLSRGSAVAKGAFGKHIGNKETSGPFATKLALLRYFSLVEDVDSKIQLSNIGRDIVRNDDPKIRQAARQRSFSQVSNYKSLLERFAGDKLPSVESLSTTLHYEFSLKEDAANKAASAFIDSARLAGLVDDEGAVGEPSPTEQPSDVGASEPDAPQAGPDPDTSPGALPTKQALKLRGPSPVAHVTVNVSLDLSAFDADDVLRILAALGVVPGVSAE